MYHFLAPCTKWPPVNKLNCQSCSNDDSNHSLLFYSFVVAIEKLNGISSSPLNQQLCAKF
jgi:hypothetical protein